MASSKKNSSLNEDALTQMPNGETIRIKYYAGLGWAPVISDKEKK